MADEGQQATLAVWAPDPKTTTVTAWLNGSLVLLPSRVPQMAPDPARVEITLSEENTLEVSLRGKPGTQVTFWVEIDGEPPIGGGDPPSVEFLLTDLSFFPAPDLSGACPEGYVMADWTQVVQAVDAGVAKEDILTAPYALILNEGEGHFNTGGLFPQDRHHALAASSSDGWTTDWVEGEAGTEIFWLTSVSMTDFLPVLCTPSPVS
jgi:hypothetical protein